MTIHALVKNVQNNVQYIRVEEEENLPSGSFLIDMFLPSSSEIRKIQDLFGITIPSEEEVDIIEVKNPFYRDRDKNGDSLRMTITVIEGACDSNYLNTVALTFILTHSCLIIIRHDEIPLIETCIQRISRISNINEQFSLADSNFIYIIDAIINNIALVLENTGNELDVLLKRVFADKVGSKKRKYSNVIESVGRSGNIISKTRESLVSVYRIMIYYTENSDNKHLKAIKEQKVKLKQISMEVQSLSEYANFLSQRNALLLDATLGMVTLEQNKTIKTFTIASAAFMPPTLIASIYGMNFEFMPELHMEFGYPFALILIFISSLIPYFYFKSKGWV